jgi:hypothetical protein
MKVLGVLSVIVVLCTPCKLFGSTSVFLTIGFSDWNYADKINTPYKNSQTHKTNVLTMKNKGKVAQKIDNVLILQIKGEKNYWKNVLRRVFARVKTLSSRELTFRDKTNNIDCNQNCNFLMSLELIALFDPFLTTHIEQSGNKEKTFTSYLSFTIFEQFKLLSLIRFLQLSPDVSHVDQAQIQNRFTGGGHQIISINYQGLLCFIILTLA